MLRAAIDGPIMVVVAEMPGLTFEDRPQAAPTDRLAASDLDRGQFSQLLVPISVPPLCRRFAAFAVSAVNERSDPIPILLSMEGRSFPQKFSDEQRSEALTLYGEHGAAEASRRLPFEVSATTIRQWARRAGLCGPRSAQTEAATRAARLGREERAEQIAAEALEAAAEFLARARATNPTNARLLMAAFRDALHGSNLLAGDPTDRFEVSDLEREIERELKALAAARTCNAELVASNGEPG
jgi:hypothetical protein